MSGGMQACRYECKYLVDQETADRIRDFVLVYLEADEFTNRLTGRGYPVHSLYLDSTDLKLCRQTLQGEKNRYKLRIRFYDDRPESPVFFEIKRRVSEVIVKQRAAVWRTAVPDLLAGKLPTMSMLVKASDKGARALKDFHDLARSINAQPAAYTSYIRAAYEPPSDNRYRVTFDSELRAGEFHDHLGIDDLEQWEKPTIHGVVLELKFTDRRPDWMSDCVQRFSLKRISVPKYVECANLVDRQRASREGDDRRAFADQPVEIMDGT
ncbi:MAG: polyphosphate polymerase domain-containing protein [Pirellulales bacterium]